MKVLNLAATAVLLGALASHAAAQQDTAYIARENRLTTEDQRALEQVVTRLNHALDAADYRLYASFFAEDAEFISGFGIARGREQITAALEQSRPFITGKRHVTANTLFSGTAGTATLTSYIIVFERERSVSYVGSAINTDTFMKRDGEWQLVRHDSKLDPSTERAMQSAMGSRQ